MTACGRSSRIGIWAAASLVLSALLAGPAGAAVAFPMEYSGSYRVTTTVKNEHGSGLCTETAALTITLQSDGKLIWEIAGLDTFLESPPDRPATCDIRPTGKTETLFGTHDRQSRFTMPSGSSLPPLTGQFDEQHLSGEYRVGPTLIEWDLPAVSHLIAIEPDPSVGFEFHKSILQRKGFKFVFRDPHGREHLDFGTLKILVGGKNAPGVDTTAHVLSRLLQGIVPFHEENPDSRTKVFRVLPDPAKLMQGHDVFAIPCNGDWLIELRICDKGGTCFGKTYSVYFGPFITAPNVFNVIDLRCTKPSDPFVELQTVTIGNIGIDSPGSAIYVGLTNAASGTWTLYPAALGDGSISPAWWQGQIQPFISGLPLASGFFVSYGVQRLPDWISIPAGSGAPYLRKLPFPGGDFKLLLAAVDGATGAYRLEEHAVRMCDR